MKHNKHRLNGILMVLTLALLAGHAQATDYTTATTGDWALTNTWGAAGKPSSAADTGLINKGAWNNAVLTTTNLGAASDYATITVATNGLVAAKAAGGSATGTTIANPVIFDGGKIGSGAWDAPGGEWTGPITITANGLISASGRNGSPKLSGKVSGPGGITFTNPDQDGGGNGLTLNNASNDFAGSVVVTQLCLNLACDHALPTGKVVNVYSAGKIRFNVSQTYASEPPPIVNLYGGFLQMGTADTANNVTNALAINVSASGGTFNSAGPSWATGRHVTGPINIASGGTLNVGESRGDGWNLDGQISGAGALRFYVFDAYGGFGVSVIGGTNNTHSGGTLVATFGPTATHTVTARGEGSLGTGPVTVESNTVMALDKTASADWTLTNTLAGAGTFKVEDGSGTYRLTAGGTVSPGTNNGHTAILRVDGKFAFAQNGGTPATLAIDVASVGTTPGVNHDQFTIDHPDATLASSITNCALVVTRVPSPTQMNGLKLTILSATNTDFTPYQFASVTGLGTGGSVVYSNGAIALTWTAETPIVINGAYSNLAYTSCDVSGILSSTGASPTVVRCYWGTNSMDTSGWSYTNDLGTQGVGTVWTVLTGLTSTVKYYYRFYATNDAGEYWSVTTSSFTTLGDVNWNDAASGNWNADNANTWGQGTGVYPYRWLNDHVTIDSHTVTLMNSLTTAGGTAPAEITLATNGTLQAGTAFTTYSIDSPVTLNGGTVYGGASGYGLTFNGPVTMQGTSTANVSYQDAVTFKGPISGTGKLIASFRHWNGSVVTFANANNTNWTGTLDITGTAAGSVIVTTNGGLGRATANVYQWFNLNVSQSYGADPKPTINVYPGGGIYFGSGSQTIASDIPVFMRGGAWSGTIAANQWYNNCTQSGPVTLISNTVVGCADYAVVWNFSGPIDGPGQFILQSPGVDHGAGTTYLSGANTYAGGTWVQSGLLVAKNTNSFGSGPVQVDYNTNVASHGVIQLAATTPSADYWVLTNSLAGDGTIKVENGAGTNTLTVLGMVAPGTNSVSGVANGAGILRVDGNVALGAGSRLRIDITGTNGVAGVDYDRLVVDHTLSGLSNAVLEIGGSTNLMKVTLTDQELVVVTNAASLADASFLTVQWNAPWRGKVRYNDPPGTVKLVEVSSAPSPGMVLMVQ